MALQIRRGLSAELTSGFTPVQGEPVYATDTKKLYIGDGISTSDTLTPVNPDITLSGLPDVTFIPATGGENTLVYNDLTNNFEQRYYGLAYLYDVYAPSPQNNSILIYDGTFGSPEYQKFKSEVLNLSLINDITITSPADGEVLTYQASSGTWINSPGGGGGGATDLNSLTDVNLSSLSEGDLLKYDSFSGQFINSQYAGGLSTNLFVYIGNIVQIEALTSNVTLQFINGYDPGTSSTLYSGISDNNFSAGNNKEVLTADGNGGLNWEQILLEHVAGGTLINAVDDAAAATAGVPVGGIYRDGSVLMVRVS